MTKAKRLNKYAFNSPSGMDNAAFQTMNNIQSLKTIENTGFFESDN